MINQPLMLKVLTIIIEKSNSAVVRGTGTIVFKHHYPSGRIVVSQWRTKDKNKARYFGPLWGWYIAINNRPSMGAEFIVPFSSHKPSEDESNRQHPRYAITNRGIEDFTEEDG